MASKYSLETKMEVVSYVLEEKQSKKAASIKFGVNKGIVQSWVYAYEKHGVEGLTTKNYFYSKYFVVKYMLDNKLSARITAAIFNIPSYSSICEWEKIYLEQGEDALSVDPPVKPKKASKEERKELLARIKQLEMENEYLKKLDALIQEKEKSKKGIKY